MTSTSLVAKSTFGGRGDNPVFVSASLRWKIPGCQRHLPCSACRQNPDNRRSPQCHLPKKPPSPLRGLDGKLGSGEECLAGSRPRQPIRLHGLSTTTRPGKVLVPESDIYIRVRNL
jgi:hypothetical protein